MRFQTLFRTAALSLLMLLSHGFSNEAEALPDGFQDHGIAAPVGREPFGNNTFAAVDGEGRRIVFMKLWTGNDASYLIIDAETGETQQIDPKIPGRGGWPVFSGPNNKIYDTLGKNFVEIDLNSRSFRKIGKFSGSMSLGYAIDSDEVIYAGIYPTGELISYDTRKDEYQDLGKISHENWPQYLRPLVAGKDGWIYVGLGQKVANLIAYHPGKRESKGLIPEKERKVGRGEVITGTDGKIYGNAPGWGWHILENGEAKPVEKPAKKTTAPSTREFPDGSKLLSINAPNKTMIIRDAGKSADREVSFSYKSSGVRIYGVTGGPDGKIYGATGIPLRVWQLDPKTGKIENWGLGDHVGHVNQFVLQ